MIQLAVLVGFLVVFSAFSEVIVGFSSSTVEYPIKFGYVNKVMDWSSATGLARSIGVPGYSNHSYTHICLTFYTCQLGALDAAQLWDRPTLYFGTQTFGSTDDQIRTNLLGLYRSKGIKVMVSAFGATEYPTTQGIDPVKCASDISNYVTRNQLDGVDVDWEDTAAFNSGIGQSWLITLTTQLRKNLPSAIITHAPQAPYFGGTALYPNNAYLAVHQAVGSSIQFYNIQFYNQGSSPYNTPQTLFNVSGGWAAGTSVNQIIVKGIPKEKIVVGKPATPSDANANSYMSPADIDKSLVAAYQHNQWKTGVMFWQFSSDPNSTIVRTATAGLIKLLSEGTSSIKYPIKFTCVNTILSQSSDTNTLRSMAVPTAPFHGYQYISYQSWTFRAGAQGSLLFWVNPSSFLTSNYRQGRNNLQLSNAIKTQFTEQGIKILVQAFGSSEMPTTANYNPVEVAINLALFVVNYNLDGVNVDYQDSRAFVAGTGQQWLTDFTTKLRELLPSKLIVHTVNAGYFVGKPTFRNGAYLTVNTNIGSLIDFYIVKYYGQGSSTYNTAESLFNASTGWAVKTSVKELIAKGIDPAKIVVGKPATIKSGDASSFMDSAKLSAGISSFYQSSGWKTGVMLYEFASDIDGTFLKTALQPIA